MDQRKGYDVVDESSSEQKFCKSDKITFALWKYGVASIIDLVI